jgi:hypothetical protein
LARRCAGARAPGRALRDVGSALCGFALMSVLACPPHAAAEIRLPPIDTGTCWGRATRRTARALPAARGRARTRGARLSTS